MAMQAADLRDEATAEAPAGGVGARIKRLVTSDDATEDTQRKRRSLDDRLAIGAAVMIPLGAIAIVLAWYGASQTPFVFEQIPYLISGGLLGIGLMLAGGLLYIGTWVARLTELERDEAEKVREVIAGLREDLASVPALSVAAVERVEQLSGKANPTMFWATPNGSMFHRRSCQVVEGRDDLVRVDDDREQMKPCGMCDPLG